MLLNPTPLNYVGIPGHPGTGKQFTYVLLNPSSTIPGIVAISALLYADDEAYFTGQINGTCYLGTINFDINEPGLLDAIENYAITQFLGFTSCNPPVPPVDSESSTN